MSGKHFKLGLKLRSTDLDKIPDVIKLYEEGLYQYIDLFTAPGSYPETITYWQKLKIPFVIHAAHYMTGMDLSNPTKKETNRLLSDEARAFADSLSASYVVFHPGVAGSLAETASQLMAMHDRRLLIENVPYYSVDQTFTLLGNSPQEIQFLLESVPDLGFCLDVGHAFCSANSYKEEPLRTVREGYFPLNPLLIHLTDGDIKSGVDLHYILGQGSFPISEVLNLLPQGQMITIESIREETNFYELAKLEAQIVNGK